MNNRKTFVCRLAAVHTEFHVAEVESVLKLVDRHATLKEYSAPYAFVDFGSDDLAVSFLKRSAFSKSMMAFRARAASLEELNAWVKAMDWSEYAASSFCFEVDTFGRSLSHEEQLVVINSFHFMPLRGPVTLKRPDVVFCVYINLERSDYLFGVKVQQESLRAVIDDFSLKKRVYLGTTSMDAELSFIMANIACVSAGDLMYDPFAGTGSLLYIASFLRAFCMGSDIDGRQMRGNTGTLRKGSLAINLRQYGLEAQYVGGLVFDFSHMPLRKDCTDFLDAIVTDPPYGVRAGAKRIAKSSHRNVDKSLYNQLYPQTVAYELDDLVGDLLDFAAKSLRPLRRLVFWYPVEWEDATDALKTPGQWPLHPRLLLQYALPQKCQRMTRWLLVYVKQE